MKNFFKLGFLALALSLSVAACSSETKDGAADSTALDSNVADSTVTPADSTVAPADSTVTPADSTKH